MEIIYSDNSIEKQLNYTIVNNNNKFIVIIKDLKFITNNINN